LTVEGLLKHLALDPRKVAVERNLEIVPRSTYEQVGPYGRRSAGDRAFHRRGNESGAVFRPPTNPSSSPAGRCARASSSAPASTRITPRTRPRWSFWAEMVTVALRRVNVMEPGAPRLVDFIDQKKYIYLPNTAGCFTAEDALRTLRLAREAGGWTLVKLEVLGDRKTLYPDMIETLRATEVLIREGFQVMSIAPTIRCWPSAWRKWARPRSCRSRRRSVRAWNPEVPSTSG